MDELVAKRYGKALFELGQETGKLDVYSEQLKSLLQIFDENKDILQILNHPNLPEKKKKEMLESIFVGKLDDDLLGLLVLMIRKKRQESLVATLEYTLESIEDFNGFIKAYVTSAIELTEDDKKAVAEKLEKQTGKKVTLVSNVDPEILGGLIIRINDRVVDSSVRSTLTHMSKVAYKETV